MNKIRLPEASQAPEQKRPPHSEQDLLILLKEVNQISQGNNDVVKLCIAFYRERREVNIHNPESLKKQFADCVKQMIQSGHHLQTDSQGLDIVTSTTAFQVEQLVRERNSFDIPLLTSKIYVRDKHWSEKDRAQNKRYSLLVKIWNRETSFKTQELNELCELIRTHMSSDKKKWLTRLVDLSIATRTQLNSDR